VDAAGEWWCITKCLSLQPENVTLLAQPRGDPLERQSSRAIRCQPSVEDHIETSADAGTDATGVRAGGRARRSGTGASAQGAQGRIRRRADSRPVVPGEDARCSHPTYSRMNTTCQATRIAFN
jgi:hypothetical protein